ncbi:MAG TPA: peptide ABC transporter ATP-binding protein [Kosmotogaceae bacterium]|nr:peptide ABC transporter ATP-binding protein [Kosmotogaceae bacterium]
MAKILEIRDLKLSFETEEGTVEALDGVYLDVEEGHFHGLIGETGCGKSITGLTVIGLLDNNARIERGEVLFRGKDLLKFTERQFQREIRGKEVAMVFQDPASSLDPVFSIKDQMLEAVRLNKKEEKQSNERIVKELLNKVKLPDVESLLEKYPHQLSGGMKQRVMIAMMLGRNPSMLIADEPTTALDVSIQAQFLRVLMDLKNTTNLTVLYITHNLAVLTEICDEVSVMYAGRIVETASIGDVFNNPSHPYTRKLVNSILRADSTLDSLEEIPGSVPRLINPPPGCRFHPRCEEAVDECSRVIPPVKEIGTNHLVACLRR